MAFYSSLKQVQFIAPAHAIKFAFDFVLDTLTVVYTQFLKVVC